MCTAFSINGAGDPHQPLALTNPDVTVINLLISDLYMLWKVIIPKPEMCLLN